MKRIVAIISSHDYAKNKGAANARILNYSRAICLDKNNKTLLLSFKRDKNILESKEVSNNVYMVGTPSRESNIYLKKINSFFPILGKFIFLLNITKAYSKKQIKFDAVIVFSMNLIDNILILFFFKLILRLKVVCEKNELYYTIVLNSNWPKGYKGLFYGLLSPFIYLSKYATDLLVYFYDKVIAISSSLNNWVKRYNPNVSIIPILSNDIPTRKGTQDVQDSFLIIFSGTLNSKKEGIDVLIKCISLLKSQNYKIKLHLYGFGSKPEINKFKKLISDLELLDFVKIMGQVTIDILPKYISKANLLVLPRPKTQQAHFGFSTKLAEYLSTGVPVLVSNVGDNSIYIKDGINGFIIDQIDAVTLANKIKEIYYTDKEDLFLIGENGYITAKENFHYSNFTEKLNRILWE